MLCYQNIDNVNKFMLEGLAVEWEFPLEKTYPILIIVMLCYIIIQNKLKKNKSNIYHCIALWM